MRVGPTPGIEPGCKDLQSKREGRYDGDRRDLIWEDRHLAAFNAVAPDPLRWALTLAETGLRQGRPRRAAVVRL
jgi:hypothetical protein